MANSPDSRKQRRKKIKVPWRVFIVPAIILVGGIGLLMYMAVEQDQLSGRMSAAADQWRLAYWKTPIPLQGEPPATYLAAAKGIEPEDCAQCHKSQYEAWRGSLHSEAMGPGVAGQFHTMNFPVEASCLRCHAPMSEQWERLRGSEGEWRENPGFNSGLKSRGITCAACHLRRHRRNGPPLREGRAAVSQAIHGEAARTPYFEASEFCKGCHQHASTSLQINGKTIENTYREWLDSPYAAQGVTCQNCHMPDRKHRWRGIHDREMTLKGVTISTRIEPAEPQSGDTIVAELTLTNTGTGHAFPTYTTPAIFLRAAFMDAQGNVMPGGYFQEKIIQRRLNMSVSPWQEYFDTRIFPGNKSTLRFRKTAPPEAASLYLWVWVEPDNFYTGFFRSRLRRGSKMKGAEQMQAALDRTLKRRYLLFSKSVPIGKARQSSTGGNRGENTGVALGGRLN